MKSYGQLCGIAKALDLIGDRWSLLILRDLLIGPMHYGELLENLDGITTNLLASRLKDLSDNKLIYKSVSGRTAIYELTDLGKTTEPMLFAIGNWGAQFLNFNDRTQRRNFRWVMVSTKRRLQITGQDYRIGLILHEGGEYSLFEHHKILGAEARLPTAPDFVLKGPAMKIAEALMKRTPTDEFPPQLTYTGMTEVWNRCVNSLRNFSG